MFGKQSISKLRISKWELKTFLKGKERKRMDKLVIIICKMYSVVRISIFFPEPGFLHFLHSYNKMASMINLIKQFFVKSYMIDYKYSSLFKLIYVTFLCSPRLYSLLRVHGSNNKITMFSIN